MKGEEMAAPDENLDLHLTQLAQWVLRTVGLALLVGGLIGGVVTVAGMANDSPVMAGVGVALGVLAFGFVLRTADAPLPFEPGDG